MAKRTKKMKGGLLRSDFLFGVEIEGYSRNFSATRHFLTSRDPKGSFKKELSLKKKLHSRDVSFEFATSPKSWSPGSRMELQETLLGLSDWVYLQSDCGFHVHFSWTGMSSKDAVWFLVCLAFQKTLLNKIKKVGVSPVWSKDEFLSGLALAISQRNWRAVQRLLDTTKNRMFRIHPQGTIEWRGPRGFMNRFNRNKIKGFLKKLDELLMFAKKTTETNSVDGLTKAEFFAKTDEEVGLLFDREYVWPYFNKEGRKSKETLRSLQKYPFFFSRKQGWEVFFSKIGENIIVEHGSIFGDDFSFVWEGDCNLIVKGFNLVKTKIMGGVFLESSLNNCTIEGGVFDKCYLSKVEFRGGTLRESIFDGGKWVNGIWENSRWIRGKDALGHARKIGPNEWKKEKEISVEQAEQTVSSWLIGTKKIPGQS